MSCPKCLVPLLFLTVLSVWQPYWQELLDTDIGMLLC